MLTVSVEGSLSVTRELLSGRESLSSQEISGGGIPVALHSNVAGMPSVAITTLSGVGAVISGYTAYFNIADNRGLHDYITIT